MNLTPAFLKARFEHFYSKDTGHRLPQLLRATACDDSRETWMSADFQPQKARRALDVLAAAQDQNWDLLDRDVRQLVLQHRSGPIWCFSTKGSDVSEAKRLNEAEAEAFLAKRGYKPASGLETQIRSLLRLHREPERVLDALDAL